MSRTFRSLLTVLLALAGPFATPALALWQSDTGGGGGGGNGGGSGGGVDVHVDVGHSGGAWYAQPMWIAIFVIGGILVLVLLVMAARGGGGGGNRTTVVKD